MMPLHAAVEEAVDGGGECGRGTRAIRRDVPALGGEAGDLDVAPIEAAVLAVDVDEVELGAEQLDQARGGEGEVDATDARAARGGLLDFVAPTFPYWLHLS